MSILIKNVQLKTLSASKQDKKTNILIEKNKIVRIKKNIRQKADLVIDGSQKAALPGLINLHTHAAMTLFKSYADDLPLHSWLKKYIWPLESKLSPEDVYWGTKLACLEMIKTGTTCFFDMYWHLPASVQAVEEMGLRAFLSAVFIDLDDSQKVLQQIKLNQKLFEQSKKFDPRIRFALGPHAIYSVSKKSLKWTANFAQKNNLLIHFHLAETEKEVKDCLKRYKKRPVEYLESIGFLGPNLVACHSVWVTEKEIKILKKYNVKIVYNPVSNMKLAVGKVFPYELYKKYQFLIGLGTDGSASNNNLDMFETMKIATLLQKFSNNNPEVLPPKEIFQMATKNASKILGLDAGEIKEGKLADIILIDLAKPEFTPGHNLISDIVYSANGSCVDTVICDGKILMQNRKIKNEERIIGKASKKAKMLLKKL